ncbi:MULTISPECIES: hypothetical protein [Streptomyces]|uniref:Uncharacterized protein n=1 Tax=Streptomyces viridochromogenes TaxID=1938 RepID=A0A0L8LCB2_STRVR|nr:MULTISPECIES: hypothetical protein [Streptomyces]KOG35878.1 hypothetical protein ADK34_03875 [Streptomyces viridochromogenes]
MFATALALTACGRLTVMPPPEGVPVVLRPAELATTWTDSDGGTLTLKPDGTFIADEVCIAHSWDEGLTASGTGTWAHRSIKKQSFVGVTFDAPHPETGERKPDSYDALRHNKVLKLWVPVGDPDNDYPNCVLTSPAS